MERAVHSQWWGESTSRKENPGARLRGYLGVWAQNHGRQRREMGACSDAVTRNIPAQHQPRSQAPRARRGLRGRPGPTESPALFCREGGNATMWPDGQEGRQNPHGDRLHLLFKCFYFGSWKYILHTYVLPAIQIYSEFCDCYHGMINHMVILLMQIIINNI